MSEPLDWGPMDTSPQVRDELEIIFEDELGEDDFDDVDFDFDCGYSAGSCSKAGSEECDWECPYSDVLSMETD